MQETLCRYLANRRGNPKTLLTCPSLVQPTTGHQTPAGNCLGSSLHTWLHTAHHHGRHLAEKRNMGRAHISRAFLLVLMSLCIAFLLTIAVQVIATSPTLAAGTPADNPDDPYYLYPDGLCQSFIRK